MRRPSRGLQSIPQEAVSRAERDGQRARGRSGEGAHDVARLTRRRAPAGMERLAAWAAAFRSTRASPNAWCGGARRDPARAARAGSPAGGRLARRRRDARAARRPRDGALRRARALGRTDVGHEGSRRGEGDVRADPRRLFRVPAPQEGGADARARARSPRPRAPRASPSLTRLSPFCLRAVRARSADHRSGQREGGPPPLGRRARFHKRASIGAALVDQWGLAASGRPRC